MADIRPLAERDLPEAQRIIRLAFGTFVGAPDPERFLADLDYAYGRFGAEHTASFAAEQGGTLVGSNFATRWGSVGFFGPLIIRPDLWDRGLGQRLVAAACEAFDAWGVTQAGLFTFPHSAKHVRTYGKFGFYPRFLTAVMAAPARAGSEQRWSRYGGFSEAQRRETEVAIRAVTDEIYEGLDVAAEMRTIAARRLGDTLLLRESGSRLAGVALCHWGPESEAGAGSLFVKFGAVRPGTGAEQRFASLLDACGDLAVAVGMPRLLAGVNLAREEAYRHMLQRGFRTEIQGVAMHRSNQPGYSRPGLFVLDDWR
ncbi:MAG TPA: GNAT family N-acetyltransferase [Stellaceae bacterium]|nr:GNAT family N-acetyltransferase [Stellaceae bacterium]